MATQTAQPYLWKVKLPDITIFSINVDDIAKVGRKEN